MMRCQSNPSFIVKSFHCFLPSSDPGMDEGEA